jgi:hypothetical protein
VFKDHLQADDGRFHDQVDKNQRIQKDNSRSFLTRQRARPIKAKIVPIERKVATGSKRP